MKNGRREKAKKGIINLVSLVIILACMVIILGGVFAGMISLAARVIVDILSLGGLILCIIIIGRHILRPGGRITDVLIASCLLAFSYKTALVIGELIRATIQDIQILIAPDNYFIFLTSLIIVVFLTLGVDNLYQRYKIKQPATIE